mmetsp:Transcript_77655/g.231406  ORF Transcript_77655/g.231406 Transcript_77655/m.231406 type:complete len:319 (-) Transcript_77655:626-1582(-)
MRHGAPAGCRDGCVVVPDRRPEAALAHLVHEPVHQAVVIESILLGVPATMAADAVLGHNDLVLAAEEEVFDSLQIGLECRTRLELAMLPKTIVEVGGKDHTAKLAVAKRLLLLPPGQHASPVHDDQRHVTIQVSAGRLHRLLIEVLQERPDVHPAGRGFIQELDPVARWHEAIAELGHLLHSENGQLLVPRGVKVAVAFACVAAGEGVSSLATGRSVEVHQHLQAVLSRVIEDHLDPLPIALGWHDVLEAAPTFRGQTIGRGVSWEINQVPVAQRQAHDVETQVRNPSEMLRLDVGVEEISNPLRGIVHLVTHVAEAD